MQNMQIPQIAVMLMQIISACDQITNLLWRFRGHSQSLSLKYISKVITSEELTKFMTQHVIVLHLIF